MSAVLTEIIQLLTGGITSVATAIGSGLQSLVTNLFVDTTGDSYALTVFGALAIVFMGVTLAIGLCRWVINFVTY